MYLEKNTLVRLHLTLLESDSSEQAIFSYSLTDPDLFASGIGPGILMNVLKGCVVFLVWAACVLFNFCLK